MQRSKSLEWQGYKQQRQLKKGGDDKHVYVTKSKRLVETTLTMRSGSPGVCRGHIEHSDDGPNEMKNDGDD